MSEIIETPLDEVLEPAPAVEVEVAVEEPPKKRGRPAGVKNKAKAAPKAPPPVPKPRAKKKKAYVPPSPDESSEEEEAPRARTRQAPELDRRALAADVLGWDCCRSSACLGAWRAATTTRVGCKICRASSNGKASPEATSDHRQGCIRACSCHSQAERSETPDGGRRELATHGNSEAYSES